MVSSIRIVLQWVFRCGMKAPGGAGNTARRRYHIMQVMPRHPQALAGREPLHSFRAWAASLTLDDLAGAAALFGLLFAALCVGGW